MVNCSSVLNIELVRMDERGNCAPADQKKKPRKVDRSVKWSEPWFEVVCCPHFVTFCGVRDRD